MLMYGSLLAVDVLFIDLLLLLREAAPERWCVQLLLLVALVPLQLCDHQALLSLP